MSFARARARDKLFLKESINTEIIIKPRREGGAIDAVTATMNFSRAMLPSLPGFPNREVSPMVALFMTLKEGVTTRRSSIPCQNDRIISHEKSCDRVKKCENPDTGKSSVFDL